MTVATSTPNRAAATSSGSGSGNLYDILELILDRGLVIDVFVRVSLVGIELVTIDARVVVASVDTYLRFAEACNRLDLTSKRNSPTGLPDLVGDMTESGARGKSKGILGGAAESFAESFGLGRDNEEQNSESRPRSRARRKQEAE